MIIAKVIREGSEKYKFQLPVIDTGVDYSEINNYSTKQQLKILYELKNRTFKDYLRHVIDNLIAYLSEETVSYDEGLLVGTSNYELVWEKIIQHYLGHGYEEQKKYNLTEKNDNYSPYISLDHINLSKRRIADSKYYSDSDDSKVDYKQLYYNYFVIFEEFISKNSHSTLTYEEIKEEYTKWDNTLYMPARSNKEIEVIHIKDGLKLTTHKVNIREKLCDYIS